MQQFLTSRRSYKKLFAQKVVDQEIIEKIVEIARWAPSAHNAQPWRYVAITNVELRRKLIEEMGRRFREDLSTLVIPPAQIDRKVKKSFEVFFNAPMLILACGDAEGTMDFYPDPSRQEAERTIFIQSVSNGICYFLLAAHSYGLTSCWYCAPVFSKATVREVLTLPATWDPQAFITLGYPAKEEMQTPPRQPVAKLLKIL